MRTQNFLAQFSNTPLYNTKAVAQETGVPADTFRAWERRYGVPHPERTEGGHRLYSERDIAIIRWLHDRTAEGLTISQAVALMATGSEAGLSLLNSAIDTEPHSWERLGNRLQAAFNDYNATRADQVLGEAFALYSLEDVFLKLVQPTMQNIGEQWHQGKLSVAVEHFASQFIRRKLAALLNIYSLTEGRGLIVIGCAPSERHDLGALLLALFLVRHGWHVIYLGAEVPQKDMLETIQRLQPDMVCLAASMGETALQIIEIGQLINAIVPRPHFGYGGRIFNTNPALCEKMPGIFLGNDAHEALDMIADILNGHR